MTSSPGPRLDVDLHEAIATVTRQATPVGSERVPLAGAVGRVLAADLVSLQDRPAADDSALDGYAVRFADTQAATTNAPAVLAVVGEARAGRPFRHELAAGQAVRIATGALMPTGADAVAAIETVAESGGSVRVFGPASREAVRPRAQDLREGDVYLRAGTRLGAAGVALAAAMGHAQLEVARRPRVLLVTTGDELVPPGSDLLAGQLYESNGPGMAALLKRAGAAVTLAPHVADDLGRVASVVDAQLAATDVDLVISSGGVSRGEHDVVRDLLLGRGEALFWRVMVRPAGPTLLARYRDVTWLGLPGNPVSSLLGCLLFALPYLQAATADGSPPPLDTAVRARVASRFSAGAKLTLHRAHLTHDGASLVVSAFANQSSGVLRSLSEAGALVINPPDTVLEPERGDVADVVDLAPYLR